MTETVGQLFELLKNTNVGQLFELPKTQMQFVGLFFLFLETQDQTSWEVGWTSQDHNPKTLGSCLNFPKLLTETVEQFFELPKTRVENLWDIDWTSRDWKSGIVVWISKDPVRKPLGSCLVFSRLQVLGSYMNCLRTQMICSCLSFPRLKVLGIFLSFPRTQVLGSCLNFPKPESKTVRQMFEVIKTQDRNSWSVVWASQEQKSWAGVWTSQDKLVVQLFAHPKTTSLGQLFEFPKNRIKNRSAVVCIYQNSGPKQLVSCLSFPRTKLSRCLNFPRLTRSATVCASQDHKCWAVVWTSQYSRLDSWSIVSISKDPKLKTLGNFCSAQEPHKIRIQNSSAAVWSSQK